MFNLIEDHEIAGLSCDIQIDEYEPADAGFFVGHPDRWEPEQPPVIEYTVINPRTGKSWPWLEKQMTDADEADIENRIIEHMEAVTY